MTITFTNLSGSRENMDKTIRYLLENNWTSANTSGITPFFTSDTEEPDQLARPDNSAINEVRVNWARRERLDPDSFDVNGDDKHAWKQVLFIEVQGEDLNTMTLFEDEVHRILWENRPNGANRLNKSDASASEVAYFEEDEPEFERLEPEADIDQFPTSQAELGLVYFKTKS